MVEDDQAAETRERDNVDPRNRRQRAQPNRLAHRQTHLYAIFLFSMYLQFEVSPTCQLVENDPVLFWFILGSMIAILSAGTVVWCGPRNSFVYLGASFVALAGFPAAFTLNLVATLSMEPCRRPGVLGLVCIAPAYLVTIPLFVLGVLGHISARSQATVGAVLAA